MEDDFMKASKLIGYLGIGVVFFSSFLAGCSNQAESDIKTIGVIQYTEHAAMDQAYNGFLAALDDEGYVDGENVKIDFKNAQGDIPTSQTITKQFASNQVDMIFAIATPAAQAAYNATKEIPILITAVTDPVAVGIAKSWDASGTNVTGTSDLTPVAKQMELIRTILPEAKNIGVIYTTSEANSEIQVSMAEAAAKELGFTITRVGVTSVNDIPLAVSSIIDKVDVMYTPTDNLVASAMPVLWNACVDKKVPVFAGEEGMVKSGGIATEGIDYYQLGYETGLMAVEVLEGKNPGDMPIKTLQKTTLILNQKNADKIELIIPESIQQKAEIVEGD